jgi:hypothetical protein
MPFTDGDRERLARIDERTAHLSCPMHEQRISRLEGRSAATFAALGLMLALGSLFAAWKWG